MVSNDNELKKLTTKTAVVAVFVVLFIQLSVEYSINENLIEKR